ncbi:trimeric intracellular cation channel family protein [uncultured Arcticibacterium sp.]|uniref:trimeric intracellular cation channel family protein n=1 Tax=uncultured Arcticibacterium sp. TaxID=2173042 RepID=UPI0030FAB524
MNWIYFFEILGTIIFVISGVMTAIDDDFDVVGSIIIGIVTAVGGGTVRDVLIGQTPVGWMRDTSYLWAMLAGVILSYLFKKYIVKLRRSMFFFDTMGIGLFTILGLQKTLNAGLEVPFAVLMGIVSAVFGGVIRDVLTNRVPLIFRREIYATACLVGALVFLALEQFTDALTINMGVSMLVVMIIRYLSVRNNWGLKL